MGDASGAEEGLPALQQPQYAPSSTQAFDVSAGRASDPVALDDGSDGMKLPSVPQVSGSGVFPVPSFLRKAMESAAVSAAAAPGGRVRDVTGKREGEVSEGSRGDAPPSAKRRFMGHVEDAEDADGAGLDTTALVQAAEAAAAMPPPPTPDMAATAAAEVPMPPPPAPEAAPSAPVPAAGAGAAAVVQASATPVVHEFDVIASRHPLPGIPPNTTGNREMAWPVSHPPSSLLQGPVGPASRYSGPSSSFQPPLRGMGAMIQNLAQQSHQKAYRINRRFRFIPYIPAAHFEMGDVVPGVSHGALGFALRPTGRDEPEEVSGFPEMNHMLLKDGLRAAAGRGRDFKSASKILSAFRCVGFMITGNVTGTDTKRNQTFQYSHDSIGTFLEGANVFTFARAGYNTQVRDMWGSSGKPGTKVGYALVAGNFSSSWCAAAGLASGPSVQAFQFVPMVGGSVAKAMAIGGVKGAGPYRVCATQVVGTQSERYVDSRPETYIPLSVNPSLKDGTGCVCLNAQMGLLEVLRDFSFE